MLRILSFVVSVFCIIAAADCTVNNIKNVGGIQIFLRKIVLVMYTFQD